MSDLLTDICFWAIALKESERTFIIHPDEPVLPHIEGLLMDASHITLKTSQYVPLGKVVILDEQALEARLRQSLQTWRPSFYA